MIIALLILACAKAPPEPAPASMEEVQVEEPAIDVAPARVTSRAELEASDGRRATLIGTIVRATPEGGEEGTAVELGDATQVFVAFGEPPHGWDWLVGTEVRVLGTVALETEAEVPMLIDPDAPMPADAGM